MDPFARAQKQHAAVPRKVSPAFATMLVPAQAPLTKAGNWVQLVGTFGLLAGACIRWFDLMSPLPSWRMCLLPGVLLIVMGSLVRWLGSAQNRDATEKLLATAPLVAAGVVEADALARQNGFGKVLLCYSSDPSVATDPEWIRKLTVRLAAQDPRPAQGRVPEALAEGKTAWLVQRMGRGRDMPGGKVAPGDILPGLELAPGDVQILPTATYAH
jgi:hypothetical protein